MNPTALDILKKHKMEYFQVDETPDPQSYILAAMREIYEIGFKDGESYGFADGYGTLQNHPKMDECLKKLFPEK